MNIENFIEDTISQIMAGIKSKNNNADEQFRLKKGVNFDLAVTVLTDDTKTNSIGGGGKVKIASIDGEKENITSTQNTVVSRVNFTIEQKSQWDLE